MKQTDPQFVVCIKNRGHAALLELRKLYQVVADEAAAELHQIRVMTSRVKTIFTSRIISSP
jgi:hypothetical protein